MIIIINSDKSYFKADERPLKQEIGIISNYIIDLSLTGVRCITLVSYNLIVKPNIVYAL